jgi:hypothetical protein
VVPKKDRADPQSAGRHVKTTPPSLGSSPSPSTSVRQASQDAAQQRRAAGCTERAHGALAPALPPPPPSHLLYRPPPPPPPPPQIELPTHELNTNLHSIISGEAVETLRVPTETPQATFVQFDKGGKCVGSLGETGRGLQLSSTGGDLAEWHRIQPQPGLASLTSRSAVVRFREGDLVGMVEGELSYRTRGFMMLGETSLAAVSLCPSPAPMQAPSTC